MEEFPDISQDTVEPERKSSDNEVPDPSKRKFVKGIGFLGLAAILASCAPKKVLDAAEKDINKQNNTNELNTQFSERSSEFVDQRGVFDYDRYRNLFPAYEQYEPAINRYAQEIRKFYDIDAGVMMALASSILVANVDRKPNPNIDRQYQRLGPMGMVPNKVLPVINKSFGQQYTTEYLEHPENCIYFSMLYMAETIKDIRNDGENRDMMSLVLANYYGGTLLQDIVKGKNSVENNQGLKDSYDLYIRTKNILENKIIPIELEHGEAKDMEDVWKRATGMWWKSKFASNKETFFKEALRYFEDKANERLQVLDKGFLALFLSIAKVESNGGLELYNKKSGARGWFQMIPGAGHLEKFNAVNGTNYNYDQLLSDHAISITTGIWALMRYRYSIDGLDAYENEPDTHRLMKFFKAGRLFDRNLDDALWWNRVKYGVEKLLGYDPFNMNYQNYYAPRAIYNEEGGVLYYEWQGPFEGSEFAGSEDKKVMDIDMVEVKKKEST